MKYIVIDTETGGIGRDVSLLSAYFGVLDENFNLLDELELFVRPDNHIYQVTAEALGINKINLVEHEKKAVTYKEAGTKLFNFIEKNSTVHKYFIPKGTDLKKIAESRINDYYKTPIGKIPTLFGEPTIEKLEPLGHNVAFDIIKIKDNIISEGSWLKFVSYRLMDTGGIGNFLKKQGKIPKDISGSLTSYAKHFNIDAVNAHDAKADCQITVAVYKEMLKL